MVIAAGVRYELCPRFHREFESGVIQRLQAPPELRCHGCFESSPLSHARAILQSRFAVLSEISRTDAISSNERLNLSD
jgi:hypothetical protein